MKYLILGLFAALTAACSSFPTPDTPREILATAEVTYNGVIITAGILLDEGIVTADELRKHQDELVAANSVLREANRVILSPIEPDKSEVDRIVELLYETIASLQRISADLAASKEGTLSE